MPADPREEVYSPPPSDDEPSEECEDDRCRGPELPIWHCCDCDSSYCSDCWPLQGPHKPNKKGRDGVPHEKSNPHVVRRLKGILNAPRDRIEIQRLHDEDECTKWFGVTRDLAGRPALEDYGRYASLLSSISPIESMSNRYPQLVSFIGVTNAGKSTLIKMLIEHDMDTTANSENRAMFPSPVVGSVVNDALPTSGDVHLYADPATHAEQLPILYADCEGFEGGERTPLGAARSRRTANSSDPEGRDMSRHGHVHTRPIAWADTEESRQREFAVTALYPRLLYTFSDCVVFVLRNAKTFQSAVLTKLLEWGASALEKSINQPALPHCIVALNGTDPGVDEREWDVNFATQNLLSSVKGALDYVEGVPMCRQLADYWRNLGKHIYSVEDLILRYYSSFRVVRIPSKPRYMKINDQIGTLHTMIRNNCEESFRMKRRARMLTNADELNVYLSSAFDHFTTHLDVPFNFMQISLLRNPIPSHFGGFILQLCTTISSQQPNHQAGRVAWMFEKMSVMLGSCVLLDCARYRKGRVDELFASYEKFFDWAGGEYMALHYPCSYVSPDGTRQCQLVKARHQPKGHQDDKGIIAAGDYQAAFDGGFLQRWKTQLRAAIEGIHRDFQYELEQASMNLDVQAIPEEKLALDLHIGYLNEFFEAMGPATSICSHSTCFCCLMDVPEHHLPCGHVLCTACIKAYGKTAKSTVTLTCCPLHRASTSWKKPAVIRFKPTGAGVRILSLDGGGIRGIVQLEVLRAIEQALNGYLPVQAFFDLIVGTGTGGLLAVALSMKDRSVDSCIDMFQALCEHAFTPRLKGFPVISQLASMLGSGPKYKTKPVHAALKTAFSEDDDLFGTNDKLRPGARVAVTSTSATGRESILLASYRRSEDFLPAYSLERPHEPEMELKVWQSVAASMANPVFFRPFSFHGKTYLDGGLRCPNPAFIADRERRLIWPDVGEPDLFLSLGTGQNRITVLEKLNDRPREAVPTTIIPPAGQPSRKSTGRWKARRVDDIIDAEVAWADFRDYAVRDRVSDDQKRRFIRFNPDLDKEPPSSDDRNALESLQLSVRKRLHTAHRLAALKNVAHRLVASSFYLELQSKATAEKSEQVCTGAITCRFDDSSMEMCALGRILEEKRTADGFEPHFLIKPDASDQGRDNYSFKITITLDVIRGMIDSAVFGLPNVYIPLRDESKATSIALFLERHDGLQPHGFPISGFPRVILGEVAGQQSRRPTRGSSERNLRSPQRNYKQSFDGDSLSLNGPAVPSGMTSTSEESWQETQAKLSQIHNQDGARKMSLADIIAQEQGGIAGNRTNRFWTYIGNQHISRHPEMYSPEEVAKFAVASARSLPAELDTSSDGHSTSSTLGPNSPQLQPPHELEAKDKATVELQQQHYYAQAREHARSQVSLGNNSSPKPDSSHRRPRTMVPILPPQPPPPPPPCYPAPSLCETEFDEDGDFGSTYGDAEISVAQASPLVQLPPPYPAHQRGFEPSPLETAIETALPDKNTATALDRWLTSQRSAGQLSRSAERLRVVKEEESDE